MALPNLTAINIYLADNTMWRTIELAGDCKYIDELEGDERVELKWESYDYEKIPVGSYVIYDNRVFRLTEPHEPSRRMENVFTYSPTFYTESYHWRKAMACYYEYSGEVTYTNSDNTISANIPEPTSRELDWSFTGNLPDALFMLLQAIKNETGSVWKAHYDSSVANQLIEITAQGLSVRDMLTQIADQCGKEFYFDYSGATPVVNIGTLELTASGEHTEDGRIVLNIGEDVGNPTVNSEAEEYFTRFYFFGSTRNIEQPTSVTKSSVVNRRLPLLSSASGNNNYYPKGFIDISGGSYINHAYTPSLPDYKVFAKSVFFDDIYPHASYKVLSVQKAYIPVKDDANQPTGERMPIYYVALYDSNDANRQAIAFNDWVGEKNGVEGQMVPTLVPSIAFRGGYLQGLEYELIYHRAGDKVSTYAADGTKSQLTLTANCFEIVFDTNANPRLPNDTIFPRGYTAGTYDGDDCTLFNIKMPASYTLNAQLELETKALQYIANLNVDKSTYEMVSDADNFERVTAFKELQLGHKVKMLYPQIAGRNLLFESANMPAVSSGIKGWRNSGGVVTHQDYDNLPDPRWTGAIRVTNTGSSAARIGIAQDKIDVTMKAGEFLAISYYIRASVAINSRPYIQPYFKDNSHYAQNANGANLSSVSTEWQYCYGYAKITGDYSGTASLGYVYVANVPVGAWVEVCGMKVERGKTAHPWTPAPEENGQSVLSRVISIERCLDLPCDCVITLGYSAKQGNIKTLREIIADTSDKTETVIREGEKNKAQILGLRNGYRAQQEALDTYFDPDGSFDGSRIKPETVQTGALAVGAKSQQFTLSGVQMSVAKYSNGNGTLSWVCDSGKLAHFSLDDEYTLIWPMATGTQALNNANAQYIYAKVAKDGFGAASGGIKTNSNSGTFVATAEQIKFDSDNNYYYFLVGAVSSAQTDSDSTYKTRIISMTYGMTTINGKQITTGVIRSSDSNHGVVINLDTGEIIGKIIFRTSQGTDVNAETYIGETAEAAAQTAVDNLEIGGRNLLINSYIESSKRGNSTELLPALASWASKFVDATNIQKIFKAGESYTISFDYEITAIQSGKTFAQKWAGLGLYSVNDGWVAQLWDTQGLNTVGAKAHFSKTFTLLALPADTVMNIYTQQYSDGTNQTIVFSNLKIEKGNKPTAWTPAPEDVNAAIEAEATALETLATTIAGEISDLQKQIDGQIMSFFYNYVPTMQNEPAATWQSQGTENVHLGDLFYDTSTGYAYRFANTGTEAQPVYSWLRITDTDVTKALADAAKAQATADKKMRTFTAQPVPPYDKGDVWLQGANGDILYCGTAKTEGQSYAAADWVTASKYIDQTTAETVAQNAVDALEIGGRNYILAPTTSGTNPTAQSATYTYDNGDYVITKASGSGFSQLSVRNAILKYSELGNKTVTISVKDIVSSNTNNDWRIYLYASKSGETDYSKRLLQTTNKETFTFPILGEGWNCGIILRVAQSGGSVGDTLTVKGLKLEKGSKSTDWTPAPEDTEAALTALQTDLQNQIDGKIETWSQVADPSSAWTTTALKDKHINDLWYYTGESTETRTNNKTYKYTKSGSTYSWAEYSAGGGDLFDRIDGKAAIFYGSPSGSYEDVEEGDFLVDGETGISYKRLNNAWVKVQDYQEAIANIKIGGRNLHKDSESLGSSWIKTNATVSDGVATLTRTSTEARVYQMSASAYWTWNADTEYAVSVEAKAEVSGVKLQIDPYGANATPKNIELTTEWKRYTFVFKSGTSVTSGSISYRANDNNSVIYIRKPKLEEGNKASAWTPAPEDVDAGISNAQSAAAAAQESADTANTTISNMNNDAVFSKLEKKSFRVEWKNIQGSVTADTTYTSDGSYAKAIAAVNGTTVGHGILDTAYTNLKNYLIKWKLDTNEDTNTPASGSGTFSQGDLGAVTAAYYNAETALYDALADYWSEEKARQAVNNMTIGAKNIASRANVGYITNAYTESNHVYTQSAGSGAGLKFASTLFTVGEKYVLTFKIKKVSGTLTAIGGHSSGFTSNAFYVDGVKSSNTYAQGQTITDDTNTHKIEVYLTYNGNVSDNNLYIQPNRGGYNTNNNVFQMWDIMLVQGTKATDWSPAPEDTTAALTALQTDLQGQIDSKIETWSQSADPSTNWTAAEKSAHTGDLWQYTGTTTQTRAHNATYRWSGSAWVEQEASSALFDKIDGKAAIWYGSTSDHPAQGETVNNGDFLVDGATGKTYKYAPTQTPNENGWVNVQDYQTPIAQLNTRISNITDDGIISGGTEKWQLKREWNEIAGTNGAGTADGSYYTIKQKASPISGSTQSLDTAFSALKTKMDTILSNMSTDTVLDDLSLDADSFNALWKAYYDAETALENTIQSFYDDRIRRNLQATCATAEGTQAKVITCAEWKDGFFQLGTKLLVRFDNANTNQHPLISVNGKLGFIRYNNTLSGYRFPEYAETTAPKWLGESVIQLEYAGTGHAEWTDGQGQTQRYPDSGDYHIWQMPDEGAFKSSQVLQRSIKGQTDIVGGLILTETIALRNAQGVETAGMTGITEANDVAFYAGGDLRSAQNGTAAVIIKHTGDAKFGAVIINGSGNGEMLMDSGGVRRLSIKNEPLALAEQGVTYNAANNHNDNSPTSGTALSGGSVTTAEKTHSIFAYETIQSPAHQYVFDVHLTISKVTIAVATAGGAGYISAILEFYNGTQWAYVDSWELYNGQVRTYEKSDLSYLMRYANPTGYAYMGLRLRYKTDASSAGTATVSLSAPKWYYYCDQNKANMQIANDGMCYYLNSANQFAVKTNNDQSLTIKARGEIDIPGVLWAGKISATGDVPGTPSFKNVNVSLSKNGTSPEDTSLYNFKYTGISGTPAIMVTPEPTTNTGTGWTAQVISLNTSAKTFSVRIKKDNTSEAAAFHLVIFGTT